ncbi:MAG TPA: ATP-dependent DNA helicase, partial [Terracidiphilus sp.]|nr:ATP-dependent DNA helicase [Terracidiphilus sp.]
MLVVAGAGTGKTTVLVRRIAHLIQSKAARPDEILVVTYTRNSAAELIRRVAAILDPELDPQPSLYPELNRAQSNAGKKLLASGLQAHTFHSYCYRLLLDAGSQFHLLDEQDLFVLLRRRIGEMKLEHYIKAATPGRFLEDLLKFFSSCHDELRTPADYEAYVARLERGEIPLPRMAKSRDAEAMPADEVLGRCREVARAFRFTEELLQKEGLGTFGHIITRAVELLSRRKSVLEREQRRARFILIDEFQDSNVAQIKLASLLAGEEANVFAVGDPDQAIYQFRGATSDAFDQFLETFGPERVKRVTMSANRRSTPPILSCAYQIIRCNPGIAGVEGGWSRKPLTCERLGREPTLAAAAPVRAVVHNGPEQEAEFVADTIEALRRGPAMRLSDIAVLYRSHSHREKLVAELTRRGIPVRVKGVDLFRTPELRDAMAVLRLMDASHPVALFRVAALPGFQVDPERFREELALAGNNSSAEAVLENVPGGPKVVETIRTARQELLNANSALDAALEIAQRAFGLADSMPLRRLQEFAKRWQAKPKQIIDKGTLHDFLQYVSIFCGEAKGTLVEEADEDDRVAALGPGEMAATPAEDAVQLMTVHAAKGLEFPCVFVARAVSQSFPVQYKEALVEFPQQLRSRSAADEADPKLHHEQEERRLFYVAMTRARNDLYLCGPKARGKNPIPSKYLRELSGPRDALLAGTLEWCLLPPPDPSDPVERIHAAAEPLPTVSQWTQLPPRANAGLLELSASAIESYENCPLAYKLRYDWRLPEDATAALQFGNAMHLALKAYFDGVRAGRPAGEETA